MIICKISYGFVFTQNDWSRPTNKEDFVCPSTRANKNGCCALNVMRTLADFVFINTARSEKIFLGFRTVDSQITTRSRQRSLQAPHLMWLHFEKV